MDTGTRYSRKRSAEEDEAHGHSDTGKRSALNIPTTPTSTANRNEIRTNKRQRISPLESSSTSSTSAESDSSRSHEVKLETPPSSAPAQETMRLNLTIPREELSAADRRTLAIRRHAAERWVPKLQRPFPNQKEMKEAYNLKLMRHYPDPSSSSVPNFIKPRIDTSPRVTRLLQRFPLPEYSSAGVPPLAHGIPPIVPPTARQIVSKNREITSSESAKRLAWQCFAATEKGRIDRGREAMMESGLVYDDLIKEYKGHENNLPEWKKLFTGKFAHSCAKDE